MTTLFVWLIGFYQLFLSPFLKMLLGVKSNCLYALSCSEYAKTMVKKKGVLIGSYLAFIRLLSCQHAFQMRRSSI